MIAVFIGISILLSALFWPRRWLVREGRKYLLRFPLRGGDGIMRAPGPIGREGKNLFLHFIRMSDGPTVHSHPWEAKALILWGRYRDHQQVYIDDGWHHTNIEYGPGSVNTIGAGVYHTLTLLTPWVLTLCWTKPKHGRGWSFLINGKDVNASGRGAAAYDEAHDDKRAP